MVDKNDTIERIALKWNTIPSDIQHLNRLSSRMLFPGQVLYVPDPTYIPSPSTPNDSTTLLSSSPISPNKSIDRLSHIKMRHHSTNKPGHIERSHTIGDSTDSNSNYNKTQARFSDRKMMNQIKPLHLRHTLSEDEAKRLDEECMQRFLKLDSKLISSEIINNPIIDGVLLITPSAIMFDPKLTVNNNDNNSIIIPLESISNVILYEDLSIKDVHKYMQQKK